MEIWDAIIWGLATAVGLVAMFLAGWIRGFKMGARKILNEWKEFTKTMGSDD